MSRSGGSTYMEFVEDCRKATFVHFFMLQESQRKQNSCNNMYSSTVQLRSLQTTCMCNCA